MGVSAQLQRLLVLHARRNQPTDIKRRMARNASHVLATSFTRTHRTFLCNHVWCLVKVLLSMGGRMKAYGALFASQRKPRGYKAKTYTTAVARVRSLKLNSMHLDLNKCTPPFWSQWQWVRVSVGICSREWQVHLGLFSRLACGAETQIELRDGAETQIWL